MGWEALLGREGCQQSVTLGGRRRLFKGNDICLGTGYKKAGRRSMVCSLVCRMTSSLDLGQFMCLGHIFQEIKCLKVCRAAAEVHKSI